MRRRPLLRAAAVGGGAYAMGRRGANQRAQTDEQDQRLDDLEAQQAAPQQAPAPPASSGGISSEAVQKLEDLGKLHDQGILTDEEFTQQKQLLLAGVA